MKKVIKKSLALFMSLAMVLGAVVISNPTTAQAADSYTATLGFSNNDWSYQDWDSSTTVTGDGTYTITSNASKQSTGALVFVIDIKGINNPDISLDDIHVYADGTEITVDLSKVLTGDIEGNGNYRIEIYNEYGSGTASNSPIDISALSFSETLTVTFTISNTGLTSEDTSEDPSEDTPEDTSDDTSDDTDDTDDTDDADTSDEETEDVTVAVNEGVSYNTSCIINLDADENMRSITITLSPLYYNEWPGTACWNDYAVAWIYVKDGDDEYVIGIASGAGATYTVSDTSTTGYVFEDVAVSEFMYGDSIEIAIPLSGEAAIVEIGTCSWDGDPDTAFITVDQYVLSSTVIDTDDNDDSDDSGSDDSDSDDSDSDDSDYAEDSSSSSSSGSVSSSYVSEAVSALEEEFSSVSSLEAVYSISGVEFTEYGTDGAWITLEDESFVAGTTYYIALSYDGTDYTEYLEVLCTEDGVLTIYPEGYIGLSSEDTMTIVVAAEATDSDDTDSNNTSSTNNTKDTSDAAPYASTLALLAGAAMVVIFRKRMA